MSGNASKRAPGQNGNGYIKKSESITQDSEDEKDSDIKHAVATPRVNLPKAPVQGEQVHSAKTPPSSDDEKKVKAEHGDEEEEEEEDDDDDDDIDSLFEDALEELGDETLVNGGNGKCQSPLFSRGNMLNIDI